MSDYRELLERYVRLDSWRCTMLVVDLADALRDVIAERNAARRINVEEWTAGINAVACKERDEAREVSRVLLACEKRDRHTAPSLESHLAARDREIAASIEWLASQSPDGSVDIERMAQATYAQQCEYVGPEHEQECVKILALAYQSFEDRIATLESQLAEARTIKGYLKADSYWVWFGDDEDCPESLTCPVMMSAERLRGVLKQIADQDQTIEHARTYTGYEGRPCALCTHENGRFVEACQMHKDLAERDREIARLQGL